MAPCPVTAHGKLTPWLQFSLPKSTQTPTATCQKNSCSLAFLLLGSWLRPFPMRLPAFSATLWVFCCHDCYQWGT